MIRSFSYHRLTSLTIFGVDAAQVCRIIRKLEPILAKIVALKKERTLSQAAIEELIMDATEQPIERPKRGQRAYYSGKKKRHTLKTEPRTTLKGRIVRVSASMSPRSALAQSMILPYIVNEVSLWYEKERINGLV